MAFALIASTLAVAPLSVGAQDAEAAGGNLFDEAADGDISGDAASPTALSLGNGSNVVAGSVVVGDIDYVTVTVPEGHELQSLDLIDYSSENARSFIGVQEGTVFTETPEAPEVANLLGFTLFGDAVGVDILGAIGTGEGAQGFTGALPAGDYTFWIQEIGDSLSQYYFDFNVAPADDAAAPEAPADEAPADDAAASDAVQVTFENLQPDDGFFFTEAWVGLHNGDFDLFNDGERATPGLEALAEGGNTELLGAEFAAPGRLQTTIGNGEVQFISPGEVIEGSIDIRNAQAYRYVSFASMIIPSNDAFFGHEDPLAYEVFDADGNFNGPITIDIFAEDLSDAGTEVNNGFGAAGFSQTGPGGVENQDSTDDTASTVGAHPGFANLLGIETAAGTTIASDIEAGEAIVRVTIDVGESINTQSAVGPLFEGSVVEDDAAAPEAPADEAPAVEEVVEEAPAVEEVVEEAPAPEAPSVDEAAVAGFPIDLAFSGLEPLGDGFVYEGWVVVDGTPVSTGRFTISEIDGERTYVGPNLATQSQLDAATDFVLTIEPAVGDDPAPAAAKPLGGVIVDGVATLTHAHPAALGDDFSSAAGQFIIATPTTADNTDDDYSGVWFIEVTDDGPVAGLDLPVLPAGWVYEGWAVIDGQPVSTGRFTDPGAPDDFGGFSGPDPNPPFPGEDFIVNAPDGLTFPTNLTDGGTIVLSIEPEDDDSPAPFAFKPLAASVDGAEVGTAIQLGAGPGFPSGTATIGAPADDAADDDAPADDAADDAPADDTAGDAPADDSAGDDADAAGSVRIVDGEFGRYLEAAFGNADTTNEAHTTTVWDVVDAGDGTVFIQNAYTGRFLSTDGSNANLADADGAYIRWELADAGEGSYYIVNASTEALLNADRPGFNVNTSTEPDASTQWTLIPVE